MTLTERKTIFSLAGIYCFRMLGLFMILPIFSLYAHQLQGATPSLIGWALGAYGLTQALCQIPLAMLSDKWGRKPVIIAGLIIFAVGSIIAALSTNIHGIIIGRALQGSGAIGSTLMALMADSIEEENRLKGMALVGMTIGLSFSLAMVLGPIVGGLVGLHGIFWLTAFLAAFSIVILLSWVPTPKTHYYHRDSEAVLGLAFKVLGNRELLKLNLGIFVLHAVLMALFLILPIILVHKLGLAVNQQWQLYLPTLFLAAILMAPFVMIAETKRLIKPLFCAAILILTGTQILFYFFSSHLLSLGIILCLFFTAFTFLEACLPSLVAKIAPINMKGTAMGLYSGSQFMGIFLGGVIGGFLFHRAGITGIFIFTFALTLLWAIVALTMKNPPYLSSKIIALPENPSSDLEEKLLALPGIKEVDIAYQEKAIYLKIDKKFFVEKELEQLLTVK